MTIFKNGEPCSHPGCLSHISHPCEGCGRVGGIGVVDPSIVIDESHVEIVEGKEITVIDKFHYVEVSITPMISRYPNPFPRWEVEGS